VPGRARTGAWQDVTMPRDRTELPRRGVLLGAATAFVALPAAACSHEKKSPPDPLLALESLARSDAATAHAIATRYPEATYVAEVGKARAAQAQALRREIDRVAGGPAPSTTRAVPPPPKLPDGQKAAVKQLSDSLAAAGRNASALVPSLPGYRAGLVGSVAAGCAGLVEVLSL
jgi:hypothetical protein